MTPLARRLADPVLHSPVLHSPVLHSPVLHSPLPAAPYGYRLVRPVRPEPPDGRGPARPRFVPT